MPAANKSNLALAAAPSPEAINGDEDAQTPRETKGRRSRQPPVEWDYSEDIRAHIKKRRRTGQACDRCKGCAPCVEEAGLECKVTDTVTGETSVRGAAGRMATQIEELKARIAVLEEENSEIRIKYGPMTVPEKELLTISPADTHIAAFPSSEDLQLPSTGEYIAALERANTQLSFRSTELEIQNKILREQVEQQNELLQLTDASRCSF
ncbi:uncharacterized protein N7482_000775 [Penicillium canariense]|uniref:Zn(2)-C6 fungal-type domain-containing protein n=1 Tax=Penicillium canariense TaxID=189055 RepID=A0A9W9IDX8_9EURO|nr:uncharacterized protein N7482_000775 [Penicillium canariense]KAJ5174898.1 hypothetical protein N7482_000775 [Penicillium canariense]